MSFLQSSLNNLAIIHNDVKRERISSWDRSGGNKDFVVIKPGEKQSIAQFDGTGCIKHIWMTMASPEKYIARKVVLRIYWDDEKETSPSVEVPIGDFFGIGHGIIKNFWSLPLTMSPDNGRSFNSFFSMPFAKKFQIFVENETSESLEFYFYIDFETYKGFPDYLGYFHAQWRRENPTKGWKRGEQLSKEEIMAQPNLSGEDNYLILEAKGLGTYVGCHLDIDCFRKDKFSWYGEGDEMIFIDGVDWPPKLHGTGTEDYFNTAYCPSQEFNTPYFGITMNSGTTEWPWKGKNSLYRFHIQDPIYFQESIRVSIETGHANCQSYDYSSTAYWYQTEPHYQFPKLLPVEKRLPRIDS